MVDRFIPEGELDEQVRENIEQQSNIVEPSSVSTVIVSDRDNEWVRSFIESVRIASLDGIRSDKMEALREDRRIFHLLNSLLPRRRGSEDFFGTDVIPPLLMKGTLYYQVMRVYDEEGLRLPEIRPVKEGVSDLDNSIIDSVVKHVYNKGQFSKFYEDVFDGFKTEGTVFCQYGYDGDKITYEKIPLENVFIDPKATRIARGPSDRLGQTAQWIVRQVLFTYGDFVKEFPAFAGKVAVGNPQDEPVDHGLDGHGGNVDSSRGGEHHRNVIDTTDKIVVHYAYNIGSIGPSYAVYAGQSATLLDLKVGDDYPYFEKDGTAYLPFEIFHFTRSPREGIYGPSMIGIIKDGAEALKQMMNRAVPNIARSVNPFIFLFGSSDQRLKQEMRTYTEMQDMGEIPLIMAGDDQVRIESVAPQSVFPEFEGFRQVILDDMGQRLGINFRIQESIEQTATEFIGKQRQQIKAIGSLNAVNKTTFEAIPRHTIDLVRAFWKSSDKEEIGFSVSDEQNQESFRLPFGAVLEVVKDWDGEFVADTDIEVPQTSQEKALAIDEITIQLQNILNATAFTTIEQIKPTLDLLYEKIVIRGLNDIVSRQELNEMAGSLIEQRSVDGQPDQPPKRLPGGRQGVEEQEVGQELAPRVVIA